MKSKYCKIFIGQRNISPGVSHWEIIKIAVAGSSVQYASRKKKADDNKIKILEKKIRFWEKERESSPLFDKHEQHIQRLQKELYDLNAKKTQAAILRCKANWSELAEKPTKYFLNLEKANFNKKQFSD